MIVFENSGLSDMTNKTKNTNAIAKQTMLIIPTPISLLLKERIAIKSGTKRNQQPGKRVERSRKGIGKIFKRINSLIYASNRRDIKRRTSVT